MNEYLRASEVVANSFVDKDPSKVHDAIQALIEGQNKQNPGTLQRFFDHRDFETPKLHTEPTKDLEFSTQWEEIKK